MKKSVLASFLFLTLAVSCGGTGTLSSSSSSPAGSSAPAGGSDACALVAKSDAETAVGTISDTPAATVGTLPGVADKGSVCAYRGANGLLTVGLLTKALTRSDFDALAKQVPGVQPISGLGDAAYGAAGGTSGVNGATLLVLKGSTYFSLSSTSTSGTGDAALDKLKTIAQKSVSKL
jgi:hypothetical protein